MPSASLPSRRQCNSLKWRTQTCKRRRDKCETVPRHNLVALIPPSPFLPVPSAKPLHVAVNVLRAQLFSSLCDRKVLWLKALFCVWSRRKGLTSADQLGSTVGSRAHLLPKGFVSPMVSETMCLKNLVNKCWKTLRFENQCVSSWRNRKTGPSWGCHPPDKEWHWAAVPSTHTPPACAFITKWFLSRCGLCGPSVGPVVQQIKDKKWNNSGPADLSRHTVRCPQTKTET
jgi:hypothetical protein